MSMRQETSGNGLTSDDKKPTFTRVYPRFLSHPVAQLDAKVLADWLRFAIEDELIRGFGARAYVNAERFIFTRDDRTQDLAALFEDSPSWAHPVFREAVGLALAEIDVESEDGRKVADTLLRFARLIKAPKVLEVLAAKAGRDNVKSWPEDLLIRAFELSAAFVDQRGKEAAILLTHIIRCGQPFHPALSGLALKTLTSAESKRFAEHFNILRPALDSRYGADIGEIQTPDDVNESAEIKRIAERRRLVREVLRVLPDRAALLDTSYGIPPQWWLDAVAAEGIDLRRHLPLDRDHANQGSAQGFNGQSGQSGGAFDPEKLKDQVGLILSPEQIEKVAKAA
jgi:hypothetical protein